MSLEYDGVTPNYVEVDDHADFDFGAAIAFSVCFFIEVYSEVFTTNAFTKGDFNTSGLGFWIGADTGKWHANRHNGGAQATLYSSTPIAYNTLTHLGLTRAGALATLYVNGAAEATHADWSSNSSDFNNSLPIIMGAYGAHRGNGFDLIGRMFDVRVYKGRALSAIEMKAISNINIKDCIYDDLVAHWALDEEPPGNIAGGENSIIDVRNGHNGTPEDSPIYRKSELRSINAPLKV